MFWIPPLDEPYIVQTCELRTNKFGLYNRLTIDVVVGVGVGVGGGGIGVGVVVVL